MPNTRRSRGAGAPSSRDAGGLRARYRPAKHLWASHRLKSSFNNCGAALGTKRQTEFRLCARASSRTPGFAGESPRVTCASVMPLDVPHGHKGKRAGVGLCPGYLIVLKGDRQLRRLLRDAQNVLNLIESLSRSESVTDPKQFLALRPARKRFACGFLKGLSKV
jgi:hypothetical protein